MTLQEGRSTSESLVNGSRPASQSPTALSASTPIKDRGMANQFTKGTRTKHDESTKDKIRAEVLSVRLEKYAKARGKQIAKHHMEPAQVAAAKVLIERGKPALQSIEQTNLNPLDQMDEEEIKGMVRALITAHPWLLREFAPGPQLDKDAESTATNVVSSQQTGT